MVVDEGSRTGLSKSFVEDIVLSIVDCSSLRGNMNIAVTLLLLFRAAAHSLVD